MAETTEKKAPAPKKKAPAKKSAAKKSAKTEAPAEVEAEKAE